jgi:hypothetical protein
MTYTFKLSRRLARFRGLLAATFLLLAAGCSSTDSLGPENGAPIPPAGQPEFATTSFAGGIPIGTFDLPTSYFGTRYNGAMRYIWPAPLLSELADIKARGGKIVLMLAGPEKFYKDANGHFSLTKWKARVDLYRNVNFSSYVSDGTIIAHYLIDEPYDPFNWNGVPVPGATLEEMAKYSKAIWPNVKTIVRAEPSLITWSGTYHYLDAAWAQYLGRKGDVNTYLAKNVADAQRMGLGLVVGLNLRDGGTNKANMTASQVQTWGSALLTSTYPCAFLSWDFNSTYLASTSMQSAMDVLRAKAQNRSQRVCAASAGSTTPPPPPPDTTTPPPSTTSSRLPFGLSLAPAADYSTRWTGTVYRADPADLVSRLGLAKSVGMRLIVSLAQPAASQNADGTFNLTKWKAEVDRFRALSLGGYVSDKTLYLHQLVDLPDCAACWGGAAIPWATVEEMAKYSKSIWPSLPTTVRTPPTSLARASFRWSYLDAGWAQYNTKLGDLQTYLKAQVAAAQLEGLGLVAGLNLTDGAGYNTPPMTASQIKAFGTVLAKQPSVCALVGWKHDATFLSQTGIAAALDSVAKVAKSRSPASCAVS